MTKAHEPLLPMGWTQPKGYANGMAARGRLVFVAGQIGWRIGGDAQTRLVGAGFVEQAAQALRNIVAVLAEARARPEHLVRLTWYVADRMEYRNATRELGRAYREIIGAHYPAMTAVQVGGFIEDGVRVEIEATAVVPD